MEPTFLNRNSNAGSITRELATALRSKLDHKYTQILRVAESKWQQKFAGNDPSDACVTVRISSGTTAAFAGNFRCAA